MSDDGRPKLGNFPRDVASSLGETRIVMNPSRLTHVSSSALTLLRRLLAAVSDKRIQKLGHKLSALSCTRNDIPTMRARLYAAASCGFVCLLSNTSSAKISVHLRSLAAGEHKTHNSCHKKLSSNVRSVVYLYN